MEKYSIVNMIEFKRKMYFDFFVETETTLDFTVKLDVRRAVEKCQKEELSFYGYTIFNITKVVNSIENMRYDLLNEKLIVWDEIIPSFTSFNKRENLFHALWINMEDNYLFFDKEFKTLVDEYKNSNHISPIPNEPKNMFNISSIPWIHFDSMSGNNKYSGKTFMPTISMGKYHEENGRLLMPISIKVHHATMDGYHISKFYDELQKQLDKV
ncbi:MULTISPECIES: CatA-like O-acetyltransferase [Carnobacterium]|uniref:CatA-like O-acetyltransferase n=1 Tax=Carnobacterium maltaromaticum TaxID=2751 RepID=A0AAW9K719_CARML|nr:CatA-like O-acetyltransferase [Carnobacterium maltaromaticum]MDZ5759537.1 CatA-like O-acetyltransferase [Carnobacterium maltaromaticum]